MITCAECIQRLYPDDPRVPVGKYRHSTCDYFCDKPAYYRELETQQPPEQVIVHRHINYNSDVSKKQWQRIDTLSYEVEYLKKKLAELQTKRRPRGKY